MRYSVCMRAITSGAQSRSTHIHIPNAPRHEGQRLQLPLLDGHGRHERQRLPHQRAHTMARKGGRGPSAPSARVQPAQRDGVEEEQPHQQYARHHGGQRRASKAHATHATHTKHQHQVQRQVDEHNAHAGVQRRLDDALRCQELIENHVHAQRRQPCNGDAGENAGQVRSVGGGAHQAQHVLREHPRHSHGDGAQQHHHQAQLQPLAWRAAKRATSEQRALQQRVEVQRACQLWLPRAHGLRTQHAHGIRQRSHDKVQGDGHPHAGQRRGSQVAGAQVPQHARVSEQGGEAEQERERHRPAEPQKLAQLIAQLRRGAQARHGAVQCVIPAATALAAQLQTHAWHPPDTPGGAASW